MDTANRNDLERLLLRGAGTIHVVEAATILLIKTPSLLEMLVAADLVKEINEPFHYAYVDYQRALSQVYDGSLTLASNQAAALEVSASLAINYKIGLRSTLGREIDDRLAVRLAEAVLFSVGYMDANVDPLGGYGPDHAGPNAIEHEERIGW